MIDQPRPPEDEAAEIAEKFCLREMMESLQIPASSIQPWITRLTDVLRVYGDRRVAEVQKLTPARVKEPEEALRGVLDEASLQAHKIGCRGCARAATYERRKGLLCAGCEAERLLAAREERS